MIRLTVNPLGRLLVALTLTAAALFGSVTVASVASAAGHSPASDLVGTATSDDKDAKKAAAEAEKDAKKAAAEAEKDAKKAAEEAEKDAKKAAEELAKNAHKAYDEAKHELKSDGFTLLDGPGADGGGGPVAFIVTEHGRTAVFFCDEQKSKQRHNLCIADPTKGPRF